MTSTARVRRGASLSIRTRTGTRLTQWARIGPGESGLTIAVARMPDKEERIVAGRLREFRAAMQAHLEAALKARAEAS